MADKYLVPRYVGSAQHVFSTLLHLSPNIQTPISALILVDEYPEGYYINVENRYMQEEFPRKDSSQIPSFVSLNFVNTLTILCITQSLRHTWNHVSALLKYRGRFRLMTLDKRRHIRFCPRSRHFLPALEFNRGVSNAGYIYLIVVDHCFRKLTGMVPFVIPINL